MDKVKVWPYACGYLLAWLSIGGDEVLGGERLSLTSQTSPPKQGMPTTVKSLAQANY